MDMDSCNGSGVCFWDEDECSRQKGTAASAVYQVPVEVEAVDQVPVEVEPLEYEVPEVELHCDRAKDAVMCMMAGCIWDIDECTEAEAGEMGEAGEMEAPELDCEIFLTQESCEGTDGCMWEGKG